MVLSNVRDELTILLVNILYDLPLSCINKFYGFQWALILLRWWQIYSCFIIMSVWTCICFCPNKTFELELYLQSGISVINETQNIR